MSIFRSLIVAGVLIFARGTALADVADVSLYFSPTDSYQDVGGSFEISILADISQSPGLVGFGFNLVWNESMMQLTDVSGTGSLWDILWDSGTPESITGFLFPTSTSPASGSGSGILLANLYFRCLQEGSSKLDIAVDPDLLALGLQGFYGPDPSGADPTAGTGPLLSYSFTEGSVTQGVAEVPEPGSIVLLSSVLIGLAFWTKRK
jgi:hypothetical protein